MSKKIIIFIWEWNSEIAFFQEFIKRYFIASEIDIKSEIIYKVKNNFIIFAHPTIWNEKHCWWDKTFKSDKTFSTIKWKIISCSYIFENFSEYEFIYFCLTDNDKINSSDKLELVDSLIYKHCSRFIWEKIWIFATKEIENWFIAWLWENFINNYPGVDDKLLKKCLKSKNIDEIDDAKWILKSKILLNTSISLTSQEFIWREFWKYLDIEQAKNISKSFKRFLEQLDLLFLTK